MTLLVIGGWFFNYVLYMPLKKQLFQIRIGLSIPPKFVKRLIKCWINCQKLQIIEIDTVLLVLYIFDGRIRSDMLKAMCSGSALRYQLWYPTWEWRNSMRNNLSIRIFSELWSLSCLADGLDKFSKFCLPSRKCLPYNFKFCHSQRICFQKDMS